MKLNLTGYIPLEDPNRDKWSKIWIVVCQKYRLEYNGSFDADRSK